jgi:hypothetical protein
VAPKIPELSIDRTECNLCDYLHVQNFDFHAFEMYDHQPVFQDYVVLNKRFFVKPCYPQQRELVVEFYAENTSDEMYPFG